MPVNERAEPGLDAIFAPRSIAVFGGSADPGTIGGRTLKYLKGFAGPVWWIGPDGDRASLEAVPGDVDQAIINLPPGEVAGAVRECIARGVRAIVLYSGGFADAGEAGRAAQDELAAICRAGAVRLLGPNSAGVVSVAAGIYSTYSHSIEAARPTTGTIAMVTQSGAVGTFALAKGVERGLGFSRFVATGNEADIDVAECIEWLVDDAETKVILVYLEAAANGARLLKAMARASSAGKPVIVLKGGSSDTGAAAAASHTGKLAGSDRIYSAALRAAGACRVASIEEMMDLAYACSHAPLPEGKRMAVITGSGGIGVMMADDANRFGLAVPPLSEKTRSAIKAMIPLAGVLNPIDTTGQILNDFSLLPRVVETVLGGEDIDIVAIFLATVGLDERLSAPLKSALIALRARYPRKVIAVCMIATEAVRAELESAGILVFDEPSRLVRLLAGMAEFRHPTLQAGAAGEPPSPLPPGPWDEATARSILESAGIPFPPFVIARDHAEAAAAALEFGRPTALKIVSADIAHKSDCGGVALDIDPADAGAEYEAMLLRVRERMPHADIDGIGVSPMVTGGVEIVLGVQRDPVFGPVVMFGLGGIHVENLDDVVFRLAPVTRAQAEEMIGGIRALPILMGARGRPAADRAALADVLVRLSDFAVAYGNEIESIEINPFMALEQGGVALDALIIPRAGDR